MTFTLPLTIITCRQTNARAHKLTSCVKLVGNAFQALRRHSKMENVLKVYHHFWVWASRNIPTTEPQTRWTLDLRKASSIDPLHCEETAVTTFVLIRAMWNMDHPAYHGPITKQRCEELLGKKGKDGTYLIRDSETIQGALCLCVLWVYVLYFIGAHWLLTQ